MNNLLIYVIPLPIISFLLLLTFILQQLKRRTLTRIEAEIKNMTAELLIPPEAGSFRGATQKYGRVKCDGIIYLTSQKLVFHPFFGEAIRLETKDIKAVTEENWFLGNIRSGQTVLVLHLADSTPVGFFVTSLATWRRALATKVESLPNHPE